MSRLRVGFPHVQRRARCTPFGTAIQFLINHVGRLLRASFFRAFSFFLGLPIYGVFSAAYVWLRRFLRTPGIGILWYCLQLNF